MIPRLAKTKIESLLRRFPAVALLGPRQSGKTTLAKQIARQTKPAPIYLDLELPSDRAKLSEPELFLRRHDDRLVIIDEVHLSPNLFAVLRGLIDERIDGGRMVGQFLLLGSAAPDLLQQTAQSLAGRIAYHELTPFLATEIKLDKYSQELLWNRGGFPKSYLSASDAASLEWRGALIQTYLERDIPSFGPRIPAETLRRFWTMLSHQQGALMNAARLATALAVSGQTITRYLDLLTDLLLVRQLRPWASNEGKRLIRSPKVFIRDSGLAHALLGLPSLDSVLSHPVAGHSWEGFIIENLIAASPATARHYFYRTSAGAEIDLVIEVASRHLIAIEIKRTLSPSVSKSFRESCESLKPKQRFLVYAGDGSYPLDKHTEAISLSELTSALSKI